MIHNMANKLLSNNFQIGAIVAIALIGLSLITNATGFGVGFDSTIASRGSAGAITPQIDSSIICTTTDGGSDIFINGFCTDSSATKREVCLVDGELEESYCTYNSCITEIINCPKGYSCELGTCVQ